MAWIEALTKSQRRELRELASVAHERELATQLIELDREFARFHEGELNAFELAQIVGEFHRKHTSKLSSMYTGSMVPLLAAFAVRRGVIAESEVSEELLTLIKVNTADMDFTPA